MDDSQQDIQQDEFGYVETEYSFRQKPDGVADPAGEAGWFLQREREKRDETLEYAGDATGIHPYHIEAIEFGDMTRMPRRLEALEMISAYAQYLGFDPEPLIHHYVKILPRPQVAPRAHHPANPAPLSSAKILSFGKMPKLPALNIDLSQIPGGTGGIVAAVAGAVFLFAAASWMMMPSAEHADFAGPPAMVGDPMPTATTQLDAAEVKVSEEALADDQAAAVQPKESQPVGGLDGLGAFIEEQLPEEGKAAVKVKATEEAQQMVSVEDVIQTPTGRVFGAGNKKARLILKAKAPVWVRVEDAQGNVVMTQMLTKGDIYRVPDREGLVVIARDGGLLSYMIDGKEKGILGTPGEILVGRSLDLKSFEG